MLIFSKLTKRMIFQSFLKNKVITAVFPDLMNGKFSIIKTHSTMKYRVKTKLFKRVSILLVQILQGNDLSREKPVGSELAANSIQSAFTQIRKRAFNAH